MVIYHGRIGKENTLNKQKGNHHLKAQGPSKLQDQASYPLHNVRSCPWQCCLPSPQTPKAPNTSMLKNNTVPKGK